VVIGREDREGEREIERGRGMQAGVTVFKAGRTWSLRQEEWMLGEGKEGKTGQKAKADPAAGSNNSVIVKGRRSVPHV
jgi:hypothetical protein